MAAAEREKLITEVRNKLPLMLLPPNSKQLFSDVTIIEIDIKIVIFRKIERNQYRDFLEQVRLDSDTVSPLRDRRSALEITE